MSAEASSGGAPASSKRARRPRAIQACNFCRSKKYKCDGNLPCVHCRKHDLDCVFRRPEAQDPGASVYSISYVKRLERRLELAEAALSKRAQSASSPPPPRLGTNESAGIDFSGVLASPLSDDQAQSQQPHPQADAESDESATDLVDVNSETNAIEYHGNTSSLAFLGLVCEEYGSTPGSARNAHERRQSLSNSPSLVMTFHNSAFRKEHSGAFSISGHRTDDFYPNQAPRFIETYFDSLHYIHPIIDDKDFAQRCEELWNGHASRQPRSFIALYYSVLALGALIRTWTEKQIEGMGRFEWSRKLYQLAEDALIRPGAFNDVHAVQTLFILAKVCQNESNLNLAYTYLGMAVRSALSVGLNRHAPVGRRAAATHADCALASRVWWGIYSLEVELSFALGRPDTTGLDVYHNREVPTIDDTMYAIVPVMLPVCRIMRYISTDIYLAKEDLTNKVAKAFDVENELDAWYASLPTNVRAGAEHDILSSGPPDLETWTKLQRLILKYRHLNVKMILFRPFLLQAAKRATIQQTHTDVHTAVTRCAQAAAETIEIIHAAFSNHVFFRTWWYNVTYTIFAASIMLFCAAQPSFAQLTGLDYLASSLKALEILDTMAESVVAKNVAGCLRPIVDRLEKRVARAAVPDMPAQGFNDADQPYLGVPAFDPSTWAGMGGNLDYFQTGMSFIDGGLWDFDMAFDDMPQYDALDPTATAFDFSK